MRQTQDQRLNAAPVVLADWKTHARRMQDAMKTSEKGE